MSGSRVGERSTAWLDGKRTGVSASPIPERAALEGWALGAFGVKPDRWYVAELTGDGDPSAVRGGPFETAEDAQAAIEAWRQRVIEELPAVDGRTYSR